MHNLYKTKLALDEAFSTMGEVLSKFIDERDNPSNIKHRTKLRRIARKLEKSMTQLDDAQILLDDLVHEVSKTELLNDLDNLIQ